MPDLAINALEILLASLVIAGGAVALVLFRPAARRRRRRRRHSRRPRIDLFKSDAPGTAAEGDA
jgi:hypothetical protein